MGRTVGALRRPSPASGPCRRLPQRVSRSRRRWHRWPAQVCFCGGGGGGGRQRGRLEGWRTRRGAAAPCPGRRAGKWKGRHAAVFLVRPRGHRRDRRRGHPPLPPLLCVRGAAAAAAIQWTARAALGGRRRPTSTFPVGDHVGGGRRRHHGACRYVVGALAGATSACVVCVEGRAWTGCGNELVVGVLWRRKGRAGQLDARRVGRGGEAGPVSAGVDGALRRWVAGAVMTAPLVVVCPRSGRGDCPSRLARCGSAGRSPAWQPLMGVGRSPVALLPSRGGGGCQRGAYRRGTAPACPTVPHPATSCRGCLSWW